MVPRAGRGEEEDGAPAPGMAPGWGQSVLFSCLSRLLQPLLCRRIDTPWGFSSCCLKGHTPKAAVCPGTCLSLLGQVKIHLAVSDSLWTWGFLSKFLREQPNCLVLPVGAKVGIRRGSWLWSWYELCEEVSLPVLTVIVIKRCWIILEWMGTKTLKDESLYQSYVDAI